MAVKGLNIRLRELEQFRQEVLKPNEGLHVFRELGFVFRDSVCVHVQSVVILI